MTTTVLERTAGAPISWGVCEVPGWGLQLPVGRVLREMSELGLRATELGAVGYLPTDPVALRALLSEHGLALTGGFNALALADPDPRVTDRVLAQVDQAAGRLAAAGAGDFVSCAVDDPARWGRHQLSDAEWDHLWTMLGLVDEVCAGHGLTHVLHPHVDSLVETADEVERVLDHSGVRWVLDTGHLAIGGYDPLAFAERHGDRVHLVHLKDLRSSIAARLDTGELTLMEAVQAGLFVPLGEGDIPIGAVVEHLERHGYRGWYVIEQDAAITSGPPPDDDGPIRDVRRSVAFIRSLDSRLGELQHELGQAAGGGGGGGAGS